METNFLLAEANGLVIAVIIIGVIAIIPFLIFISFIRIWIMAFFSCSEGGC